MDPISLIVGIVGALSATGGLASVVLKLFQSFKAERDLKSHLTAESLQRLQAEFGAMSAETPAVSSAKLNDLRANLDKLVTEASISTEAKKVLLSALRQSSDAGKTQYARKLYAEVSGN